MLSNVLFVTMHRNLQQAMRLTTVRDTFFGNMNIMLTGDFLQVSTEKISNSIFVLE